MMQLTVGWASPTDSNVENILVGNAHSTQYWHHKTLAMS